MKFKLTISLEADDQRDLKQLHELALYEAEKITKESWDPTGGTATGEMKGTIGKYHTEFTWPESEIPF